MTVVSYLSHRIENFSAAWFSGIMGVGVTASVLYDFPFPAHWLRVTGIVVWGITMFLFAIFQTMLALRFILFPKQLMIMLRHPVEALFMGTYPVAFIVIVNMTASIFGQRAWKAVYAMWWIDVVMSVVITWGLVYLQFSLHKTSPESIGTAILLPTVPIVVAASSGGQIVPLLPQYLRESTTLISFMLWGNGQALAFCLTIIVMYRLMIYKMPPRIMGMSIFLLLGPLGQGATGIMAITEAYALELEHNSALRMIPLDASVIGSIRYFGIIVALFMMGYSTFWFAIALITYIDIRPYKFHFSWWALTFPIGAFSLAWKGLADLTGLLAFKVIAVIFAGALFFTVSWCTYCSFLNGFVGDSLFDLNPQAKLAPKETDPELGVKS